MSQNDALVASYKKARQGYLLQELVAVREALIGSQALIRLIEAGHPAQALTETAFSGGEDVIEYACVTLNAYVSEIAMGDALLRSKQKLLRAPTAPSGDTLSKVKTKPDWEPLFEYLAVERAAGALRDDAVWQDNFNGDGKTWRARLEQSLGMLNTVFGDCEEPGIAPQQEADTHDAQPWDSLHRRSSRRTAMNSSKMHLSTC